MQTSAAKGNEQKEPERPRLLSNCSELFAVQLEGRVLDVCLGRKL